MRISISSTRLPYVLIAIISPPTAFALPGVVTTVVMPLLYASSKQKSRGLTPSIARTWGVKGSLASLQSSPSKLIAFSIIPR